MVWLLLYFIISILFYILVSFANSSEVEKCTEKELIFMSLEWPVSCVIIIFTALFYKE